MPSETQQLLHISHARQDETWVRGVLIPALGLEAGQYWTRAEDELGAPKLEELERAVQACRYTLLVASSAAKVDEWTQFAGVLAQHAGLEEGKPRLLVVARDFEPGSARAKELLPLRQRCLVLLDCSDSERTAATLTALAEQLKLSTTIEVATECPYPGLRMFGAGDAASHFDRTDLFFGRDDEGRDIVLRLRRDRRVLLVGPSGCGKSSLVRARVLPALAQGAEALAIAVARPGAHPDVALRAALDALDPRLGPALDAYLAAGDDRAARAALVAAGAGPQRLLYVDQLEEVFLDDTPDDRDERARFFARLTALGHVPGVAILLGMRADFYGDLMRSPAWDDFKDHRVELAPLRGAGLRLAITRPAEVVGVHVEVDLVERLVREADQDRAAEALPLLQVALEQLWAQREWRYLSLASYARFAEGQRRGLDVVLAHHADQTIAALDLPAQVLARRVLIDLVHLGEGRPDTRRRRDAHQLCRAGDDEAAVARVIEHLSARRLITAGAEASAVAAAQLVALPTAGDAASATERHVDLAHDALITGWPTLAGWIAARRDDLRTQRRLEARAAGGGLLADTELPEFARWTAKLATPAGRALGASEALLELTARSLAAQVRRKKARWRLLTLAFVVLSAAIVTVSILAVRARRSEQEARVQAREAARLEQLAQKAAVVATRRLGEAYLEQGRQALLVDGRPLRAISYLTAARDLPFDTVVLRTLFAQATRNLWTVTLRHEADVGSAEFSHDGARVVTASVDGTARIWDAATGRELLRLRHDGALTSAEFSPDGVRVVTVSEDKTARVWDAATGRELLRLRHDGALTSAELSPDGARIVTASADNTPETNTPPASPWETRTDFEIDLDGESTVSHAQVWDAATGRAMMRPLRYGDTVWSAAFSADGVRVVTASRDMTARVWDAATGLALTPPLRHHGGVKSAAFSADGARVVTASDDKTAQVWDAATGRALTPPLRHDDAVSSAAFSADGARVVTASLDNTARVWDAATGRALTPPLVHDDEVRTAAFSPDGARVVTASYDKTARVWDAATGQALTPPLTHDDWVNTAAFSPDGARVVTASADKTARVWDAATGRELTPPLVHDYDMGMGDVRSAAFSADGARVVTASEDKTARVWDAATGRALTSLKHGAGVRSAKFSPDSARVVTASSDKTARVWDAATGRPLTPPLQHDGAVLSAAFNADGAWLVTASGDKAARVWDAAAGRALTPPLVHDAEVMSAAFSADDARVVTASLDKTARVWDAATGRTLTPPLVHDGPVWSAAFSADGAWLVTASGDKTARVWDAATGRALTPPLVHDGPVWSAAFSADGARVVTASEDKTARVWDAATGRALTTPLVHGDRVWSAAFSADGTRVVTASDQTARVWDAATGRALMPPLAHDDEVTIAAFSPDGTRVVTSSDNTARIWDLSRDDHSFEEWQALADSHGEWIPEREPNRAAAAGALAQRFALEHRTAADELSRASNLVASAYGQLPRFPATARTFATEAADLYRRLGRDELTNAHTCLAIISILENDLVAARRELGTAAPSSDAELVGQLATAAENATHRPALAQSIFRAAP